MVGGQNQRTKRRTQRQRNKSRHGHRNRNRRGKLLVKSPGDAPNKSNRHKYGHQHQDDRDNRRRHFTHGPFCGFLGAQTMLPHVTLDIFDHDDRIIHDYTYSQHHPEQRDRVDGKSQGCQSNERTDQRDRNRHRRNDGRTPVLQEQVDDQHNQDHGFRQGLDHFLDGNLDKSRGVVRDIIGHTGREMFCQLIHLCPRAANGLERIRTG